MTDIEESLNTLKLFFRTNPTEKIKELNKIFTNTSKNQIVEILSNEKINTDLLQSAYLVKHISAQIDVKIHCLGILFLLGIILVENEIIESLALGADSTSEFDLTTNFRVAEFKFAEWKGGDSMRSKKLFQDYFKLAEYETSKRKMLYVYERDPVEYFLTSSSSFTNILDKEESIRIAFNSTYGNSLEFVNQYYQLKKDEVEIIGIKQLLNN